MLKNRLGAVIGLAAMVALAIYGAVENFSSRVPQQHQVDELSGQSSAHERRPENVLGAFWKWTTGEPVAFYTAVLSFFSGTLVIVSFIQIRYLIRADNTARITAEAGKASADAAKRSADAAVAAERARFYVVIEDNFLRSVSAAANWDGPFEQEERPLPADVQPMAGIRFKNYGKTPGIIVEVGTAIEYSETVPDPVWDVRVINANIIAADDLSEKFGTLMTGQMTIAQAKKVRSGNGNIWISGYVSYDDVFGERQVHRFLQRLVRVSQSRYALQAYDYKHYNKST